MIDRLVAQLVEVEDPFMQMDLSGPGPGRDLTTDLDRASLSDEIVSVVSSLHTIWGVDLYDAWGDDKYVTFAWTEGGVYIYGLKIMRGTDGSILAAISGMVPPDTRKVISFILTSDSWGFGYHATSEETGTVYLRRPAVLGTTESMVEREDPFMHMDLSGPQPGFPNTDMDLENFSRDIIDAAKLNGFEIRVFGGLALDIRYERIHVWGGPSKTFIMMKVRAWNRTHSFEAWVSTHNPARGALIRVLSDYGFVHVQNPEPDDRPNRVYMSRPYRLNTTESIDKLVEVEDPFMHMDFSGKGPGRGAPDIDPIGIEPGTRARLEQELDVDEHGRIKSLGKFQDGMIYAPYFYERAMDGGEVEEYEHDVTIMQIAPDEKAEFEGLLEDFEDYAVMEEDDSGFVTVDIMTANDLENARRRWEEEYRQWQEDNEYEDEHEDEYG